MKILAIDPGTTESALVLYNAETREILHACKEKNEKIVEALPGFDPDSGHVVIEMIKSYGMAVGDTTFQTCVWIGRFMQAWRDPNKVNLIGRKTVVTELCGNPRAKDPNVRAELINRFGPGADKAIGSKKNPGPLYGIKADMFSALAIAIVYAELHNRKGTSKDGMSFLS